ncbi:hypothetical protein ABPG75_002808 [Micractinium tetrahymenae]
MASQCCLFCDVSYYAQTAGDPALVSRRPALSDCGLWALGPAHLASLAPPDVYLPWLADAAEAAVALHAPLLRKGLPPPLECLSPLADLACVMLAGAMPASDSYRASMQSRPALAANLFALLEPGLPAAAVKLALPEQQRPSGFCWQVARDVVMALASHELAGPLTAHLNAAPAGSGGGRTAGGADAGGSSVSPAAQRLLSGLGQLIELELASHERVGGSLASSHALYLASCCQLLGQICRHVNIATAEQQRRGTWRHGEQHPRLLRMLRKSVALMPHALQLVCCSPLVGIPPPPTLTQQAPPQPLPASLGPDGAHVAQHVCLSWEAAAALLGTLVITQGSQSSAAPQLAISRLAEVAEWCTAVATAMRVLPLAAGLSEALQRPGMRGAEDPGTSDGPDRLGTALLGAAASLVLACCDCLQLCATARAAMADAVAGKAALAAVWQLHSALCRLVHGAAAGGAQGRVPAAVGSMLPAVAHLLQGAFHLSTALERGEAGAGGAGAAPKGCHSRGWSAALRAMGAATWQAYTAWQELLLRADKAPEGRSLMAQALVNAARFGPAAVAGDPGLHALLQKVLESLLRLPPCTAQVDACCMALYASRESPRLCAHLLRAGLMGRLVLAAPGPTPGVSAGLAHAAAMQELLLALDDLLGEGRAACGSARDSSGMQGSGGEAASGAAHADAEAQACRQHMRQTVAALEQSLAQEHARALESPSTAAVPPSLLGPAEALAAALQEWWALPEQAAAAQLEAAQAAAARSCANLRCPNLGLEGGAAAGQGVGCKRCSGCRVSYYCGERGVCGVGVQGVLVPQRRRKCSERTERRGGSLHASWPAPRFTSLPYQARPARTPTGSPGTARSAGSWQRRGSGSGRSSVLGQPEAARYCLLRSTVIGALCSGPSWDQGGAGRGRSGAARCTPPMPAFEQQ